MIAEVSLYAKCVMVLDFKSLRTFVLLNICRVNEIRKVHYDSVCKNR